MASLRCGDADDCNKKVEDEMLKAWQEKIDQLNARMTEQVTFLIDYFMGHFDHGFMIDFFKIRAFPASF